MHYWIGDVLNRVSRDAFGRGEPLLSALCVKADGTVGERYAAAVGRDDGDLTGTPMTTRPCSGWPATATSRRPISPPTAAHRP